MRRINLIGKTFGKLTVVKLMGPMYVDKRGQRYWLCKCDCGVEKAIAGFNLRFGHTTSCGCKKLTNNHITCEAANMDTIWQRRACSAYQRAKRHNIPFGFKSSRQLADYCESIAPTHCPVFGFEFTYVGNWQTDASMDKIIPKEGYIPGNIQIISQLANTMKQDATPEQLQQFAKWVLK